MASLPAPPEGLPPLTDHQRWLLSQATPVSVENVVARCSSNLTPSELAACVPGATVDKGCFATTARVKTADGTVMVGTDGNITLLGAPDEYSLPVIANAFFALVRARLGARRLDADWWGLSIQNVLAVVTLPWPLDIRRVAELSDVTANRSADLIDMVTIEIPPFERVGDRDVCVVANAFPTGAVTVMGAPNLGVIRRAVEWVLNILVRYCINPELAPRARPAPPRRPVATALTPWQRVMQSAYSVQGVTEFSSRLPPDETRPEGEVGLPLRLLPWPR